MTDSQDPSADSARQQRLRFVFREIDFDGTGNVYTAELLELLSPRLTFRGAWTDELNNEVVEQLDGDGHLKVDADLFVSAYAVALPAEQVDFDSAVDEILAVAHRLCMERQSVEEARASAEATVDTSNTSSDPPAPSQPSTNPKARAGWKNKPPLAPSVAGGNPKAQGWKTSSNPKSEAGRRPGGRSKRSGSESSVGSAADSAVRDRSGSAVKRRYVIGARLVKGLVMRVDTGSKAKTTGARAAPFGAL